MSESSKSAKLLWKPSATSRVELFWNYVSRNRGLDIKNFYEFHDYSVTEWSFWLDCWNFLGIRSSVPPNPDKIIGEGTLKERPVWFPGARLNYAENMLKRRDDGIACTSIDESGRVVDHTYRQLFLRVQDLAASLRAHGIKKGDRVAAVVTNSIEAVVLAFATASIGAIYSSTAPDMGPQGILDRYTQIKPKIIIAETEVVYGGKTIGISNKIKEIVEKLHDYGLEHVVLIPSRKTGQDFDNLKSIPKSMTLAKFLQAGDGKPLIFEQLEFDVPLYIMYSSGTTGAPKCIVHSAGGVLLQTMKNLSMGLGIGRDDTLFQYTTTGWMMWQNMIGAIALGGRVILYDGTPFHPTPKAFLKMISDQRVTVFGTSPRFLTEIQGRNIDPLQVAPFPSLRTISVTGAVLTEPVMEWTQEAFGPKIHLISTCGGTDICASFVTGTPALPVYLGEIQAKALGMKVEVFDPEGKNIEHTGESGELVCTRAHPSIPFFWGDKDDKKFISSYYEMYPGIWRMGDFMSVNPQTKGIMILGRSDGVLNPSGVRFGSGEIYAVLERFTSIMDDVICVGQRRPQDKDERVLLFVKMRKGNKLTPDLEKEMKTAIKAALSARHVPAYVFEVEDIPYTVNGKKIEIGVKQTVSGKTVKPSGAVANPEAFKLYERYRDLEKLVGQARAKL